MGHYRAEWIFLYIKIVNENQTDSKVMTYHTNYKL